jgi:nitronate monooxygenase
MRERIREMWNDQRLLDLLDIEHPILQAPMAGATTPELVAAVNGAGGLGSFGAAGSSQSTVQVGLGASVPLARRQLA